MEKATSDSKIETSKVNSKLDDHVKVYNLCMSDINLELLNILFTNYLAKNGAVVPGKVELSGPSDSPKGIQSSLGCWVLPASTVWVCA